jgi:hypothetical protein
MRAVQVSIGFALAALALGGCKKNPASDAWLGLSSDQGHGRFAGIGIYSPGAGWTKMVAGQPASDGPAAQLADDDAVIVVVDSRTGEVRGCGNMTGYCIGMNPWKGPLPPGQVAPVPLTTHSKAAGAESSAPASSAPSERG